MEAWQNNIITKTVYEGLKVLHPVALTLYLLPKVHKDSLSPPGRPIVSGCGSLCEPTCRFLDFYLKPCVESLPSYVRDSMDVLRHLDGLVLESDIYLVTADVKSQ